MRHCEFIHMRKIQVALKSRLFLKMCQKCVFEIKVEINVDIEVTKFISCLTIKDIFQNAPESPFYIY